METSAKTGNNVDNVSFSFIKLFSSAAAAIIEKIKIGDIDPSNEALGIKKGDDIQNSLENREKNPGNGGDCNC